MSYFYYASEAKIIYPRKMLDIQLVRYLVTLYFQNVIGHSSVTAGWIELKLSRNVPYGP